MSVNAQAASGDKTGEISTTYRNYALIVLMLAYTMNYIDRQILGILLEPIKQELGLSDKQLGFLSGFTFAIFYGTLGVPIAMWADRGNRRNIIALALAIFSSFTLLCGFAMNYLQLVLARICVGVGEAGSTPPSHSMIGDLFPPEKRGAAIGVYALGFNVGVLIAYLAGGWITQYYSWRVAFMVVGIPGLLMALLVRFTLKEPPRGRIEGLGDVAAPRFGEVIAHLWKQKTFVHMAFGAALICITGYAMLMWMPAFLSRSFHMSQGQIGTMLALTLGVAGGLGTWLTGVVADRLGKRDIRWNMWVVVIILLIQFPATMAMYMAGTPWAVTLLFIYPAFAASAYMAPSISMTQQLVTVRMRALASAVFFLMLNLVGMGIGPWLAGTLSDLYEPRFGTESLRYALLTLTICWLWAAFHFYMASRRLPAEIERMRSQSPL